MAAGYTISLDAMGGDAAPEMVIEGMRIARVRFPDTRYLLYGDERRITPFLNGEESGYCEIRHTEQFISGSDKPSQALRKGRQSSMRLAIDSVRNGDACGVVSAGNTGALMAMAKFSLRTLPGIDRPALISFIPTERGESVMLDLGANVVCDSENLVQFALMGAQFAHAVLGFKCPRVGLLNVGEEELKGNATVKAAHEILQRVGLDNFTYHGFIEGNDITEGTVDVIVTDGFTGNVALKTAEGTARLVTIFLRQAFRQSIMSRIGYMLAAPALRKLRERLDPQSYNGGVLLGLNGIVVKSHGGANAEGFANAIGVALDMARDGTIARIKADFENVEMGHLLYGGKPEAG